MTKNNEVIAQFQHATVLERRLLFFRSTSCLHKYKRLACRVCGNALEKFVV